MKVNKAKKSREMYFAMMGQECCPQQETDFSKEELLEHYDESLWIYQDMLRRAIQTSDHEEIKSLRQSVQEIKIAKRELLAS